MSEEYLREWVDKAVKEIRRFVRSKLELAG